MARRSRLVPFVVGSVLALPAYLFIAGAPKALAGDHDRGDAHGTRVPANDIAQLAQRFGPLTDLVGHAYEIDARWADGTPIRARSEYRADLGGNAIITRTWTNGPDGEMYQRYLMLWTCNPNTGMIETFGADFTGVGSRQDMELVPGDENTYPMLTSLRAMDTPQGTVTIKQHVVFEPEGAGYGWKVWQRAGDEGAWDQIMDGRWVRADKLAE